MHARLAIRLFLALALAGAWAAPGRAELFTVDTGHSTVLFRILHMGVSNAWGRFDNITGTVDLDEADPAKSALDITIGADSVNTGVAKRDEHLRGPDFFNARQFPRINFKSDSVRATGPDTYEVAGTLTLHGVSRPVTVTLKKVGAGKGPAGDQRVGVETGFTIKRSDFGMKNMLEGIGDSVLLVVSLESAHK
jgi:polyisoprenoid-binding protein YceI